AGDAHPPLVGSHAGRLSTGLASAPMPIDPAARALIEAMQGEMPPIAGGDAAEVRAALKARMALPVMEDVASSEDRTIPGPDGEIPVRVYQPLERSGDPAPGIVFF